MGIVSFSFDKQRELRNVWRTVNSPSRMFDFSKFVKPEVAKLVSGKSFENSGRALETYNQEVYRSYLFQIFPRLLDDAWSCIEENFISRLEHITGKKFLRESILGLVTTSSRCPYNPGESWFMVSFLNSIPGCMLTAGHELLHMHIHDYFFDYLIANLGEERAHDLKEAITTVLLNAEFRDLWIIEDKGYEKHSKLRQFIHEQWLKERNFSMLLKKCVQLLT
jgi:hypothetical protein